MTKRIFLDVDVIYYFSYLLHNLFFSTSFSLFKISRVIFLKRTAFGPLYRDTPRRYTLSPWARKTLAMVIHTICRIHGFHTKTILEQYARQNFKRNRELCRKDTEKMFMWTKGIWNLPCYGQLQRPVFFKQFFIFGRCFYVRLYIVRIKDNNIADRFEKMKN